jgi:hypothetical protein
MPVAGGINDINKAVLEATHCQLSARDAKQQWP